MKCEHSRTIITPSHKCVTIKCLQESVHLVTIYYRQGTDRMSLCALHASKMVDEARNHKYNVVIGDGDKYHHQDARTSINGKGASKRTRWTTKDDGIVHLIGHSRSSASLRPPYMLQGEL